MRVIKKLSAESTTLDSELLGRFVASRDEEAFAELVSRYEPVVLGAALRRTGDVESAHDVSQEVFVTLAKKASMLLKHRRLGGWLYKAACFEALRTRESDTRRRIRHERLAEETSVGDPPDLNWELVEESLARLSDKERDVIVGRYFEDRSYRDLAKELGMSEAAVRKRVSRAVKNLGEELTRRGVGIPTLAVLTGAIAVQSQITARANTAMQALESASAAATQSSLAALTISSIAMPTMIKTTAAGVLLAMIPLVLQWSENRATAKELALLEKATPRKANQLRTMGSAPEASRTNRETRELQAEFAAVREQRRAAERELQQAEAKLQKLRVEVVLGFGDIDEVSASVAEVFRLILSANQQEDVDDQGATIDRTELFRKLSLLQPLAGHMRKLGDSPDLAARFHASLLAEVGELDVGLREEIASALQEPFRELRDSGMTLSQMPEFDQEAWLRRHDLATTEAVRSIAHLLPEESKSSDWWRLMFEVSEPLASDEARGSYGEAVRGFFEPISGLTDPEEVER